LKVAQVVFRENPSARLLLVGEGPLRQKIADDANRMGIGDKVVFAGSREDVIQLFATLIDVHLFPSLFEGLGLVVIESQAAGVPSVISDSIPSEVEVVPGLVYRHSLSDPVSAWAATVRRAWRERERSCLRDSLSKVLTSRFNIQVSTQSLIEAYDAMLDRPAVQTRDYRRVA